MPEVRRYTVIQEREVEVTASDPVEAVRLADDLFTNGDGLSDYQSKIRVTEVRAREAY
jgi:hypothetical protein